MFAVFFKAILQWRIATHDEWRHKFGDFVTEWVWIPKHSSCIANGIARFDRSKRDDLGNVVTPIFVGGVANHLVAVPRVKVHVDIGH